MILSCLVFWFCKPEFGTNAWLVGQIPATRLVCMSSAALQGAELSRDNKDPMACKTKLFTDWPFKEKVG